MAKRISIPHTATSEAPEAARAVGYVRVSTGEQVESGLGLAAQRAAIEAECDRRGWVLGDVFSDEGAVGQSTRGREGLAAAMAAVEGGTAEVLMVSKLDRLSRSLADFSRIGDRAAAKGFNLVVLDLAIDIRSPSGELVANTLAASAQWERRVIGSRTRGALAQARVRGTRLGRPSSLPDNVRRRILRAHRTGDGFTVIANTLNKSGVPTAAGGKKWYPSTVRAICVAV